MKRNRTSLAFAGIMSLAVSASLFAAPLSAMAASNSKFINPFKNLPTSAAKVEVEPKAPSQPETPAEPAEPEVKVVAPEDIEVVCRSGLEYGGADASVLATDNLRIVASKGDVWVIQWGPGGVVAPEPAPEPARDSEAASGIGSLNLGALSVPELAAVRAASLAPWLYGALVADGDLTSPAQTRQEAAASDSAQESLTSEAPEGSPADAPKPPQVKSMTWIVLDDWGNPGSAFAYEFVELQDGTVEQARGQITASTRFEMNPEKQSALTALVASDGCWSLEDIWWGVTDPDVKASSRVSGVVPYTPEGLPLCDWVWYVDQPAWDESYWVEDARAWGEERFVETGGHWEGTDSWTCPECGAVFWDEASAAAHPEEFIGLYYGYIMSSGYPDRPWICASCLETFDNYEFASEHAYWHAECHTCYQSSWSYWQTDGYWQTVHHDAQGHWESIHHDEVGHWGYPEGVTAKTK